MRRVCVYDIKLYSPHAAAVCGLWKDTCDMHVLVTNSLGFGLNPVSAQNACVSMSVSSPDEYSSVRLTLT